MKISQAFASLATILPQIAANPITARTLEQRQASPTELLVERDAYCENTAANRTCWGYYSIEDDWYVTTPDTGVTREVGKV